MGKKMKRKIKSYFVFTSFSYRFVIFAILPLVMTAFGSVIAAAGRKSYLITPYLIPFFMIVVEIAADNWMFGGIQAKDAERMDFLRASRHGMEMMKDALIMDLLRRLFSMAGITALCLLAETLLMGGSATGISEGMPMFLSILFFCYDVSVLGTLAARFATAVWINILVGYAGVIVGILGSVAMRLTEQGVLCAIMFAVLAVPLNLLTVETAMEKVRGGYYDK